MHLSKGDLYVRGLGLLGAFLLAKCATPDFHYEGRQYRCAAQCYFRNAEGALEREWMEGRAKNVDYAWTVLQNACLRRTSDRNQAELQILFAGEHQEDPEYHAADKTRDCRQE